MKFSSLFFFNLPWHGPTTDDRSDKFPDGWLPSNRPTYGVCECKHAITNTPKEKITRWKIGRAWGPRHVSKTGNEVPGKHVSNSGHCQVSIATEMANPEEKNANPPPAYLLSTTDSKDVRFPWVTLYESTKWTWVHMKRPEHKNSVLLYKHFWVKHTALKQNI